MNNITVIKTEDQHHSYLSRVEELVLREDDLSREEISQLEVLTVIIESYENSRYPIDPVDPIEAVKFRMHEKGLKQSDLIPFIGPSGRVSEVLSKKRPLTVSMIRALSQGLGISADVLIGPDGGDNFDSDVDWSKFPIKEILQRGWIDAVVGQSRDVTARRIEQFISSVGLDLSATNFRRTLSGNADSPTSTYALYAWLARVIQRSRESSARAGRFVEGTIDSAFMHELAHLSWFESGPQLGIEFLRKNGVAVVIEPHLKGTNLDGAALKDSDGSPIIGLTLRYDRIDNFWFTLLHEVAHLWKHSFEDNRAYLDDLSRDVVDKSEAEANKLASEAFIPRLIWRRSEAYLNPSRQSIEEMATNLRIHPAIIAGRLQRERGDFSMFRDLLGQGQIKRTLGI